jgi:Glyoxalase-like domain
MGRPEERMNADQRIDHLVYATPDLAAGVARIAGLLGVEPAAGGQHPGRGTRNALVRLGPRTYLEVVGPDSDQPPPRHPRWFDIDVLREPRLVTWATMAIDIEELAARAGRAGVALGAVGTGRRTRVDGVELVWRFTDPGMVVCDGIVPFLIEWGTTSHPAATAPDGGALVALRAEHPDPSSVERCLRALDLDMSVARGDAPALVATIRTRGGDVELR